MLLKVPLLICLQRVIYRTFRSTKQAILLCSLTALAPLTATGEQPPAKRTAVYVYVHVHEHAEVNVVVDVLVILDEVGR